MVNYVLQHTLRSLCFDSQWIYGVFWRILPRNYPPPKWDTEGGILDRSKGNKRNWILVWEDGYCDFSGCAKAVNRCSISSDAGEEMVGEAFQPEIFFKMSHEVYNYGEGLMGKVAADNSHKWVYKEPPENDINFLSSWHGSLDPHPRTWEAQFKSGIQTIAVVAVREGLIQLGSLHKIVEDLNFVIFLQRKFNYLQSIPGVFAVHPPLSFDLKRPPKLSSPQELNPWDNGSHHGCKSPSPTKDHSQFSGMKRPADQFMDMRALKHHRSTTAIPLMQPSMSSLQALLSKLPSVTSSDHHQPTSHIPPLLSVTIPLRPTSNISPSEPSFQKSCLTHNSTADPSSHSTDFADSKVTFEAHGEFESNEDAYHSLFNQIIS